jgi:molecular chaperone DnaK
MKAPVVGIDLGTTNTVVGVVRGGETVALADADGHKLIPSVVSFHPSGSVLVGRAAKERRFLDPKNTVFSVKRLIGRSWSSGEVKEARSRFPFDMQEGPGNAALVVARGETYTLPEISAFVLRKAKQVAEAALGEPVERAVVTVPANFNDLHRAATKVAARVAGLEVLRILNEPTAAALAYGYGRGRTERVAVYDFGGGTFDVTLLDLSGDVFEVLATAGDTFLGGDDIDLSIAERMADEFLAEFKVDPRANVETFERLRAGAEVLKLRLSDEASATIQLSNLQVAGRNVEFNFTLARAELDAIAARIVDRTFDVCREALGIARLEATAFDQVLLVGGGTRMPLVRARVQQFFKKPPLGHLSPDEVVAMGAAIQASSLAGTARRRSSIPAPPAPARRDSAAGIPRPRSNTHPGLAPAPHAPPAPVRLSKDPSTRTQPQFGELVNPAEAAGSLGKTVGGVGGRGRVPTGTGLGPSVPAPVLGASVPASPGRPSPASPAGMTAAEAALRARIAETEQLLGGDLLEPEDDIPTRRGAESDPPLPLVGVGVGPSVAVRSETPPTVPRTVPPEPRAGSDGAGYRGPLRTLPLEEIPDGLPLVGVEASVPPKAAPPAAQRPAPPAPRTLVSPTAPNTPGPGGGKVAPALGRTLPLQAAPPAAVAPRATESTDVSFADLEVPSLDLSIPGVPLPGAALPGARPPSVPAPPKRPSSAPEKRPSDPTRSPAAPAQGFIAQSPAPPPWQPPAAAPLPIAAAAAAPPIAAAAAVSALGALGAPGVAPLAPPLFTPMEPVSPAVRPLAEPRAPLLVDVTPLSLTVETVGGFCDAIIPRNTPVPCERTRTFATAVDQQTTVYVRVGQGESPRFAENTVLGELELSGLTPAPRGKVQVAVTFVLDTDGLLDVHAKDLSTGNATRARVKLVGLPEHQDVAALAARHAARPSF